VVALTSKVTQAADAMHRNKIAGECAAVAQGVVGGNSGTEQRRCFGVSQSFRYRHQRLYGSDDILLITAVLADARNFQITAIAKISTPALATGVVLAPCQPTPTRC